MSVAYEPRSFHDDSPYAPVGEDDHGHDHEHDPVGGGVDHLGLNKYITGTEANVDDMADLAAATYVHDHDHHNEHDSVVSPFNTASVGPDSPDAALLVGPPNVDSTNVPIRDSSGEMMAGDAGAHQGLVVAQAYTPATTLYKHVAKQQRTATKTEDGLYECKWNGCNEEKKMFQRKCEWSKHMDKHERPYVCAHQECEKVQGFTYSGGLLRHQREVHGEHGGPKKALNCPHVSCKRNKGKGFSRLENLQEHLRRVHRDASEGANGVSVGVAGAPSTPDSCGGTSDVASAAFARVMGGAVMGASPPTPAGDLDMMVDLSGGENPPMSSSKKRKRSDVDGADGDEAAALREEQLRVRLQADNARLKEESERRRAENEDLRRELAETKRLYEDVNRRLQTLHNAFNQTT